ncbi:MAG: YhbY family RNA-binding protein [Verrucomicrobiota bacterium]|nr:YhbY family RNA-binding protein [Verrucomicrobiota bacterium]
MLTGAQRTYLRGLAQLMKPQVILGKEGASHAVLKEVNAALDRDEVVKLRLPAMDKELRTAMINAIVLASGSELAGTVGHIAVIYKQQADPEKRKVSLAK